MLVRRLYRIFQRYAAAHVAVDVPIDPAISNHELELRTVRVQSNRLLIDVIGQVDQVEVQVNQTIAQATPVRDVDDGLRFAADIPLEIGPAIIRYTKNGKSKELVAPTVSKWRLAVEKARVAVRFVFQLILLLPTIYRWKRKGDLGAREDVKERLGLVVRPPAATLADSVFITPDHALRQDRTATLVIPVFNAFDLLEEVLRRVDENSGDMWRLVLVDDASTDPRVQELLQSWSSDPSRADRVTLITRDHNEGFVKAANAGLKQAQSWSDDPVVLLNSDAFVPEGWLDRLLAPLADPTVASVTPMSNDAEILSVPVLCQRSQLAIGAVDIIDSVARRLNTSSVQAAVPTGVGFCMAMAPSYLRQVPLFDTAFGRGYGEENDWCQKTQALGGRHLGIGSLFVEHRGGTSFGSVAKQKLLEQNLGILTKRHPSYDDQVRAFIADDPLATARLALGLGWASTITSGPVPVFLGHALGGGAEIDLERRIAAHLESEGVAVVVRVGLPRRWQIELHTPLGVTIGATDDTDVLTAMVRLLPERRVIYSCGVGDKDPIELPGILLTLADDGDTPIDVLMHDFFPISPSYTLLGSDGRYRGPPMAGNSINHDPAHVGSAPSLEEWQSAWGRLFQKAERVVVFSPSSADIVTRVYPFTEDVIEVIPHTIVTSPPKIAARSLGEKGPVIGVLGNIGTHKGAEVVQNLSRRLAKEKSGRLVVIGELDGNFDVVGPSVVHGAYQLRDLPGLVARYGISCWFVPSIWPETYSFTTHEALATGMPVFAFDLGAQGDAVAAAVAHGAPGAVLPLQPEGLLDPTVILETLRAQPIFMTQTEGVSQ